MHRDDRGGTVELSFTEYEGQHRDGQIHSGHAQYAAAAVVTVRIALLVGVVGVLLVGTVLAIFSPPFRRWLELDDPSGVAVAGLFLPGDVMLHPALAWARVRDSETTVGADDLIQTVVGPLDEVVMPPPGTVVEPGEPLFQLRRGDRTLTAASPCRGTGIDCNESLSYAPSMVNESPYRT